jgi:predicted nucleic acid-binding protein
MRDRKAFFDTNVLIYALAEDDPRAEMAETLLARGGVVGVQTLNEFVAVVTRKLAFTWDQTLDALTAIRGICSPPVPVTVKTHETALKIAARYRYHIYDSLVIAAAMEASCSILYSEDMRNGQVVDGLMIRNPFQEPAT